MITTQFQSKEEVTASSVNSTRQFTSKIKAVFKSIILFEKQIEVTGLWIYLDSQGKERKVNDISFKFPVVHMKQIEFQMGNITTNNIYSYASQRIGQIFPLILNQELAEDPNANFGLSGNDVELIS